MSIEYMCNSQTGRTVPPELFFNSNEMSVKNFTMEWGDNSKRQICLITTLPTWLTMESPKSFTKSPYRFDIRYDPSHADASTIVQLVFELKTRHHQIMTVSIALNFWQGRPRGERCCNCAVLGRARNRHPKFQTLCGHTLCQGCLKMKLKTTRIKTEKETFRKYKYNKCPECQRNIYETVPVEQKPRILFNNLPSRENAQVVNERHDLPVELLPCSTCNHESDFYCTNCRGYYCNDCSENFHTGEYSGHRFTDAEPLEIPSQPPSPTLPEPDVSVDDFKTTPSRSTDQISCQQQKHSPKKINPQTKLGENLENMQQMATRLKEAGKFLKTKMAKMPGIGRSFAMENAVYKTMENNITTKCSGQPQRRKRKLQELKQFLKDKEKECQDALLSLKKDHQKINGLREWIDDIRKKEKDVMIDMEDVTNQVERVCRLKHRWNIVYHPLNDYHIPKDAHVLSPMLKPSRKRPHG